MHWWLGKLAAMRRRTALPPAPAARPPVADWRRLPGLRPGIAPRPVLVGGTLLGSPSVTGTRPLIRDHSAAMAHAGPGGTAGRVAGVIVPKPPAQETPGLAVANGGGNHRHRDRPAGHGPTQLPELAHRRQAPPVAGMGARPVLVEATAEFVGEPIAEDNPYTSSAWLRMVQAYRRPPVDAGSGTGPVPGMAQHGKDGEEVTSWPGSVPAAPPHRGSLAAAAPPGAGPSAAGPPVAGPPGAPVPPSRRASLAESRRLGIGIPFRRAPGGGVEGAAAGSSAMPGQASQKMPELPGMAGLENSRPSRPGGTQEPARTPGAAADAPAQPAMTTPGSRRPVPLGLGLGPAIGSTGKQSSPQRPQQHGEQGLPQDAHRAGPAAPASRAPRSVQGSRPPAQVLPLHVAGQAGPAPATGESVGTGTPVPPVPGTPPDSGLPVPGPPVSGLRGSGGLPDSTEPLAQAPAAVPNDTEPPKAAPAVLAPLYRPAQTAPAAAARHATAVPRAAAVPHAVTSILPGPLVHRARSAQRTGPEMPAGGAGTPAPAATPASPAANAPAAQPAVEATGTEVPAAHPGSSAPSASAGVSPELMRSLGITVPPFATAPKAASPLPATGTTGQLTGPGRSGPAQTSVAPYDLADSLRRLHGIDVSDVPINRGPAAGHEARMAGTRAFTRAGQVVLPDEEGPFERPQTRALLAHELTHAAQQRALGPGLPAEDSAYGRQLEAAAVSAQRRVLAHDVAATMSGPPLPHAAPYPAAGEWPAATGSAAAAPIQREGEEPAHTAAAGNAFDPTALLPQQGPAAVASRSTEPLGVTFPGIGAMAGMAGAHATDGESAASSADGTGKRLLNLDDPKAVDELTDGIYKKVHARLRHELLVDRERSGLLSDFR